MPRILKEGCGLETVRRWLMCAPRSWPARIIPWVEVGERRAWRAVRMERPVLSLLCGVLRGEERP